MARLNMPSTTPLDVAAGLSVAAIITAWPEPLAGGWMMASAGAAAMGVLCSVPFWRAAQQAQKKRNNSPLAGIFSAMLEGALVAVTLLHLANAVLPPGRSQEAVLTVTDKYVSTGRRGRKYYHVVTTPVPGDSGSTSHSVGGLFANSGSYADYQVGGCMALRWRPGWWWPVVVRRQAEPCAVPAPPAAAPAKLPLASPGPAWPQVDADLALAVGKLALPEGGIRIEVVASVDADGRITTLEPAADADAAAFQAVAPVLMARPGTLAGGPTRVRLWLKLLPG